MASEKLVNLKATQFADFINGTSQPILVDFWAPWCGPCKAIAPVLEELAEAFDGSAVIAKINVDEEGTLATQYKVMSIPTLILFKNGAAVDKKVGAKTKNELSEWIKSHI